MFLGNANLFIYLFISSSSLSIAWEWNQKQNAEKWSNNETNKKFILITQKFRKEIHQMRNIKMKRKEKKKVDNGGRHWEYHAPRRIRRKTPAAWQLIPWCWMRWVEDGRRRRRRQQWWRDRDSEEWKRYRRRREGKRKPLVDLINWIWLCRDVVVQTVEEGSVVLGRACIVLYCIVFLYVEKNS